MLDFLSRYNHGLEKRGQYFLMHRKERCQRLSFDVVSLIYMGSGLSIA